MIDLNYYKDKTYLISTSAIIDSNQQNVISNLVSKWRHYQGPKGYSIESTEQIELFLKQFYNVCENDLDVLDGLILLLDQVQVLSRNMVVNSLISAIRLITRLSGKSADNLIFSTLGSLKDSSNHLAYYLSDLTEYFGTIDAKNIRDIDSEAISKKTIVFFEDAFYSGTQIISIFQEMLGMPEKDRIICENHGGPLKPEQVEILQSTKCYISFCYCNEENIIFVEEEIRKLGLDIEVLSAEKFPPKIFEETGSGIFKTAAQKEKVKSVLISVGRQLLNSVKMDKGTYKDNWDEDRVLASVLGYNNAQQTVILPTNTPTYTITALWLKGRLESGVEWMPLFPRLSK